MAEEAAAVAERWDRAARNGADVDANAEMVRLALRVVGRAIFGDDVARAGDVLDSAFPVLNRHTFRRAMSPLAPPASWPTPDNRRAARARRALYEVVDELIAHRQQAGADGDDLLSRLLHARDPDSGESMDLQQVRDEALIFLLAGHETTSTALTFTLHLLGRHAGEQQLVHEELDAVLDGRAPTLDDAPALERTAMAIKEAMRLYPPAYALGRLAVTDNEIGGYLIPAGSFVVGQPVRHPPPSAVLGRPRGVRPRSLYRGARARAASATPTSRSEAARAPASDRTSRCSRPPSPWPNCCSACGSAATDERVPLDTQGITLRPKGPVPIQLAAR